MSTIKKGKKLTVSTGNGINREQTQSLGVLEISGKGVSELVNNYNYDYDNVVHGKAQLVIGKTDGTDKSTLQLAVDTNGNSIIEALTHNSWNKHIIMQQYGGNVGIGTDSPDSKLHVNGNITIDAVKTGNATGVGGGISFRTGAAYAPDSSTGAYNCSILTYGHDPNTDGLSINGFDGVSFCTGGSTRNERMRIRQDGNVGINSTNPGHTLEVDGTLHVTGKITTSSVIEGAVTANSSIIGSSAAYTGASAPTNGLLVEGNVGIGTTNPLQKLSIGPGKIAFIDTSWTTTGISFHYGNAGAERKILYFDSEGSTILRAADDTDTATEVNGVKFQKYNGDTVMSVLNNGRVGIGTTLPRCTMDIAATDALIIPVGTQAQRPTPTNLSNGMIRYNTTTVQFEGYGPGGNWGSLGGIKDVNGDTYIQAETSAGTDNDDLEFFTSGNQRMIIDSSGNVGIGTDNPSTNLHIRNDTGTTGTGDAFIPNLSNNTSNRKPTECLRLQGMHHSGGSGSGSLLRFTNHHASGTNPSTNEYNLAGIAGYDVKNNWGGGLCFYTAESSVNGGGNLTPKMVIDSSGNVGIGTVDPLKHYLNSSPTGGTYSTNDRALTIYGNNPSTNNGVARLIFSCNSNHTASIFAQHTSSGNTHMGFLTTNGTTAPSERMRITHDGRVGIGTVDPSHKLEVKGDVGGLGKGICLIDSDGNDRTKMTISTAGNSIVEMFNSNNKKIIELHSGDKNISLINSSGNIRARMNVTSGDNGVFLLDDSTNTNKIQLHSSDISYFNGGNVGIGLTNPSHKLEVAGDISCNNLRTSYVTSNPDSTTYIDMNYSPIRFVKSDSEKMRVSNNIEIGQYSVTNLDISGSVSISNVGAATASNPCTLDISATDAIHIPVGTEAQRPTTHKSTGMLRYNTDTNEFEGYGSKTAGNEWGALSTYKNETLASGSYLAYGSNITGVEMSQTDKDMVALNEDGTSAIVGGSIHESLTVGHDCEEFTLTATNLTASSVHPSAATEVASNLIADDTARWQSNVGGYVDHSDEPDFGLITMCGFRNRESTNTPIHAFFSQSASNGDGSKMYFVGGSNTSSTYTNNVWEYTLSTNSWTELTTTGTTLPIVAEHALVFYNNALYVFGGWVNPNNRNTLHKLDLGETPAVWSLITTNNTSTDTIPKRRAARAVMWGSKLLVYGGYSTGSEKDLWEIDLDSSTPTWNELDDGSTMTNTSVDYGVSLGVYQDKLSLLVKSKTPYTNLNYCEYDLTHTGAGSGWTEWIETTTTGAPSNRRTMASTMIGDKLYFYGGVVSSTTNLFYVLNVTTRIFTQISSSMSTPFLSHCGLSAMDNGTKLILYGSEYNASSTPTTPYTLQYAIPTTFPTGWNGLVTMYESSHFSTSSVSNLIAGDNSGDKQTWNHAYWTSGNGSYANGTANSNVSTNSIAGLPSGTSLLGEWFQIHLTNSHNLKVVELYPRYNSIVDGTSWNEIGAHPKTIYVLGSSDATSWNFVEILDYALSDYFTSFNSQTSTPGFNTTTARWNRRYLTNTASYQYYRFVVTNIFTTISPNDYVNLGSLRLYNTIPVKAKEVTTNNNKTENVTGLDTGNNYVYGQWFQVDVGGSKQLYKFQTRYPGNLSPWRAPTVLYVLGSLDGTNWANVKKFVYPLNTHANDVGTNAAGYAYNVGDRHLVTSLLPETNNSYRYYRFVVNAISGTNIDMTKERANVAFRHLKIFTATNYSNELKVYQYSNTWQQKANALTNYNNYTNYRWEELSILVEEASAVYDSGTKMIFDNSDNAYFFGGYNGSSALNNLVKINLQTNEVTKTPVTDFYISSHASCYHNGNMYIVGGQKNTIGTNLSESHFNEIHKINLTDGSHDTLPVGNGGNGTSENKGILNYSHTYRPIVFTYKNKLMLTGMNSGGYTSATMNMNYTIYSIDLTVPEANYSWSVYHSPSGTIGVHYPIEHHEHSFTLNGDKLYVMASEGEFDNRNNQNKACLWEFNMVRKTWKIIVDSVTNPFKHSMEGHVMEYHDGKIYFAFGSGSSIYRNEFHVYNIKQNTWTQITPPNPPSARILLLSGLYKGEVYIGGGLGSNGMQYARFRVGAPSFGHCVAMNGDGSIVAYNERSVGIGNTGKVHVKIYNSGTASWDDRGTPITSSGASDYFGHAFALSKDGNRIIIGDPRATQTNAVQKFGKIFIYDWSNGTDNWETTPTFTYNQTTEEEELGWDVDINNDGTIALAIGPGYDYGKGIVRTFKLNASTWTHESSLDISMASINSDLYSLSLSGIGDTFAVGGLGEDTEGFVKVYKNNGSGYTLQVDISNGNTVQYDKYGASVSLDNTGERLVIGATQENQELVNNSQANGIALVYKLISGAWLLQETISKDIDATVNDLTGHSVTISDDGNIVMVGAKNSEVICPYKYSDKIKTYDYGDVAGTGTMVWSDTGNMGIGVSVPTAKLDIAGDIKCTNLIITGTTTSTSTQDSVTVGNQTATNLIATDSMSVGLPEGATIQSKLDVKGNAIIGNAYAGIETAPTNGLIIEGNVGIGRPDPRCTMDISATDALIIPVGTDAQRPTNLSNGMIRYNTSTVQFEGYGPGEAWGSLGGIKDVDGDTYIQAETSAGTDNDELEFFTSGSSRMIIDASGNVGIGTSMIIDASGNVGIGTTSPEANIQINQSVAFTNPYQETNQTSAIHIVPTSAFTHSAITFAFADNNKRGLGAICGSSDYGMEFLVNRGRHHYFYGSEANVSLPATTTNDLIMIMRGDNKRVGIGTVSPGYKLEVIGTANITSDLMVNGNVGIGTTNPSHKLQLHSDGDLQLSLRAGHGHSWDPDDCTISFSANGHTHQYCWQMGLTESSGYGPTNFMLCYASQHADGDAYDPNWNSNGKWMCRYDGTITNNRGWLSSDDRLKNNEKNINNILNAIDKLQVKGYFKSNKMYHHKHDYVLDNSGIPIMDESGNTITDSDYNHEIGLIAQEVRKIPEFANCVDGEEYGDILKEKVNVYDDSGNILKHPDGSPITKKIYEKGPTRLHVNYNDLFCYHIAATQELHQLVKSLQTNISTTNTTIQHQSTTIQTDKAKIAELETKNTALEEKVSTLETTLSDLLTRIASLEGST